MMQEYTLQQWEYLTKERGGPMPQSELNVIGSEGWELVNHQAIYRPDMTSWMTNSMWMLYTFKRPKAPFDPQKPELGKRYHINFQWGKDLLEDDATYVEIGSPPFPMFYTDRHKFHVPQSAVFKVVKL